MKDTSSSAEDMVARARRVGPIPSDDEARRWLRAVVSILSDWGGSRARTILSGALPQSLRKGAGSSGRSVAKALAHAGAADPVVALHEEAGKRAAQPDPGKVGATLGPLLALVRESLPPDDARAVAADLPPAVAAAFLGASTAAPWRYRLIPQSYERPCRPAAAGE